MKPATDFQMLRKAVREAEIGTGSVRKAIQSAKFFITGRNFTGLIRTFRNSKEWEKALEIFETMRVCDLSVGEPPNFYTFSATISVCSKSGQLEEALWLLKEMKDSALEDPSLMPDAAVYRLIILCCIKKGRCDDAVDMLCEMSQEGINADEDTLENIVMALVRVESWKLAIWVLNGLHACGAVLSVEHYGDFIEFAVKAGSIEVATEVFLTMQMLDVKPDQRCCDNIVHATIATEDLDTAIQLLEDMRECEIPISNGAYACVLVASMEARCMESGLRVVNLMEKHSS